MIRRAASSYDAPDTSTGVAVFCIHALDDQDLAVCRDVKREDLTDVDRPWAEWPAAIRCAECQRLAPAGRHVED